MKKETLIIGIGVSLILLWYLTKKKSQGSDYLNAESNPYNISIAPNPKGYIVIGSPEDIAYQEKEAAAEKAYLANLAELAAANVATEATNAKTIKDSTTSVYTAGGIAVAGIAALLFL
jgi:hypothetical protein